MATAPPPGVTRVDTTVIAEALRAEIRRDVTMVPGVTPRLVGFLANRASPESLLICAA